MSEQLKEQPTCERHHFSLGSFVAISGVLLTVWGVIWVIQASIFNERIEFLEEKLKMAGEKYYLDSQVREIQRRESTTILPSPYFTFYSLKNDDTLTINENIHIDGFLKQSDFDPNDDFIWVFFKLNDNYYIKPNSQASFDSDYWTATVHLDKRYDSVAAFKVKRSGHRVFQKWTTFKFGGIKIDEFPPDAIFLGAVTVNTAG